MSESVAVAVVAQEEAAAPGSRQCQVLMACEDIPPGQLRRLRDFAERCPNQAEALIWCSCPNGHQCPEEVCSGHLDPPGNQWRGPCASEGLLVPVTMTVIGWI